MSAVFAGLDLVDVLLRVSRGETPAAVPDSAERRAHAYCHAGAAGLRGARGEPPERPARVLAASCQRGPYAGSREELTPVTIDWMSFVPPTVTALWLLATPAAAHYLAEARMGSAVADAAKHPHHQDHGRRRLSVPAINFSRRLILPGLGVVVFLFAYLAQNVWHLFHIDDITRAIRNLDQAGVVIGMAMLGFVEATIVLCFYIPGTAVVIVLLLGMQPGWAQAWPLVAGLMAGTMRRLWREPRARAGVAATPAVAGRRSLFPQGAVTGSSATVSPLSSSARFIPTSWRSALRSWDISGPQRVWRYFVVAGLAQLVWWSIYASAADLVASQNVVSSSNFQLYVAALFSVWFLYELFSRQPQNVAIDGIAGATACRLISSRVAAVSSGAMSSRRSRRRRAAFGCSTLRRPTTRSGCRVRARDRSSIRNASPRR